MLLARGWFWDREWAAEETLMAPKGTIWLDPKPCWSSPNALLGEMERRLTKLQNADPLPEHRAALSDSLSDTTILVSALRELLRPA